MKYSNIVGDLDPLLNNSWSFWVELFAICCEYKGYNYVSSFCVSSKIHRGNSRFFWVIQFMQLV